MNGHVIPGTPIAVDFWKVREYPSAKIFFLTHLHGDHVVGLTSSWRHRIYCSEINALLLTQKFCVRRELIQILHTDTSYIVPLDENHGEQMTVTMFNANHCPGSAMFLFDGYFGKILYTGDFRFHENMTKTSFDKFVDSVDVLYLDNTYCTPKSAFPSREKALEQIIDIIRKHPHHDVIIGVRSLGKEDMLVKIAVELDEYVSVPPHLLRNAEIFNLPEVFTNQGTRSRIRVVPFSFISRKSVEKWNEEAETIVILPTALYYGIDSSPFAGVGNTYVVPYSDHSSYDELLKFVAFVKPKSVIPIVSTHSRGPFGMSVEDRGDMTCFDELLSTDRREPLIIPESVKQLMHRPSVFGEHAPCKLLKNSKKRKQLLKPKKPHVMGVEFTDDWSPPLKLRKRRDRTGESTPPSRKREYHSKHCSDPGSREHIDHYPKETENCNCIGERTNGLQGCRKTLEYSPDCHENERLRGCSDDQIKVTCQVDTGNVVKCTNILTPSSSSNTLAKNYSEGEIIKSFRSTTVAQDSAGLLVSHTSKNNHDLEDSHSSEISLKTRQTHDRHMLWPSTMPGKKMTRVIPLLLRHQRREAGCKALFDKFIYK